MFRFRQFLLSHHYPPSSSSASNASAQHTAAQRLEQRLEEDYAVHRALQNNRFLAQLILSEANRIMPLPESISEPLVVPNANGLLQSDANPLPPQSPLASHSEALVLSPQSSPEEKFFANIQSALDQFFQEQTASAILDEEAYRKRQTEIVLGIIEATPHNERPRGAEPFAFLQYIAQTRIPPSITDRTLALEANFTFSEQLVCAVRDKDAERYNRLLEEENIDFDCRVNGSTAYDYASRQEDSALCNKIRKFKAESRFRPCVFDSKDETEEKDPIEFLQTMISQEFYQFVKQKYQDEKEQKVEGVSRATAFDLKLLLNDLKRIHRATQNKEEIKQKIGELLALRENILRGQSFDYCYRNTSANQCCLELVKYLFPEEKFPTNVLLKNALTQDREKQWIDSASEEPEKASDYFRTEENSINLYLDVVGRAIEVLISREKETLADIWQATDGKNVGKPLSPSEINIISQRTHTLKKLVKYTERMPALGKEVKAGTTLGHFIKLQVGLYDGGVRGEKKEDIKKGTEHEAGDEAYEAIRQFSEWWSTLTEKKQQAIRAVKNDRVGLVLDKVLDTKAEEGHSQLIILHEVKEVPDDLDEHSIYCYPSSPSDEIRATWRKNGVIHDDTITLTSQHKIDFPSKGEPAKIIRLSEQPDLVHEVVELKCSSHLPRDRPELCTHSASGDIKYLVRDDKVIEAFNQIDNIIDERLTTEELQQWQAQIVKELGESSPSISTGKNYFAKLSQLQQVVNSCRQEMFGYQILVGIGKILDHLYLIQKPTLTQAEKITCNKLIFSLNSLDQLEQLRRIVWTQNKKDIALEFMIAARQYFLYEQQNDEFKRHDHIKGVIIAVLNKDHPGKLDEVFLLAVHSENIEQMKCLVSLGAQKTALWAEAFKTKSVQIAFVAYESCDTSHEILLATKKEEDWIFVCDFLEKRAEKNYDPLFLSQLLDAAIQSGIASAVKFISSFAGIPLRLTHLATAFNLQSKEAIRACLIADEKEEIQGDELLLAAARRGMWISVEAYLSCRKTDIAELIFVLAVQSGLKAVQILSQCLFIASSLERPPQLDLSAAHLEIAFQFRSPGVIKRLMNLGIRISNDEAFLAAIPDNLPCAVMYAQLKRDLSKAAIDETLSKITSIKTDVSDEKGSNATHYGLIAQQLLWQHVDKLTLDQIKQAMQLVLKTNARDFICKKLFAKASYSLINFPEARSVILEQVKLLDPPLLPHLMQVDGEISLIEALMNYANECNRPTLAHSYGFFVGGALRIFDPTGLPGAQQKIKAAMRMMHWLLGHEVSFTGGDVATLGQGKLKTILDKHDKEGQLRKVLKWIKDEGRYGVPVPNITVELQSAHSHPTLTRK